VRNVTDAAHTTRQMAVWGRSRTHAAECHLEDLT
jgi:hypothetical protein